MLQVATLNCHLAPRYFRSAKGDFGDTNTAIVSALSWHSSSPIVQILLGTIDKDTHVQLAPSSPRIQNSGNISGEGFFAAGGFLPT